MNQGDSVLCETCLAKLRYDIEYEPDDEADEANAQTEAYRRDPRLFS